MHGFVRMIATRYPSPANGIVSRLGSATIRIVENDSFRDQHRRHNGPHNQNECPPLFDVQVELQVFTGRRLEQVVPPRPPPQRNVRGLLGGRRRRRDPSRGRSLRGLGRHPELPALPARSPVLSVVLSSSETSFPSLHKSCCLGQADYAGHRASPAPWHCQSGQATGMLVRRQNDPSDKQAILRERIIFYLYKLDS